MYVPLFYHYYGAGLDAPAKLNFQFHDGDCAKSEAIVLNRAGAGGLIQCMVAENARVISLIMPKSADRGSGWDMYMTYLLCH